MKYTETIRVNSHDTDSSGEVRPSVLVRYVQETVYLQFFNNPPAFDDLRTKYAKTFLISKYKMKVLQPLYANDVIEVTTWALPSRGFSFLRAAEIKRAGERVALFHMVCALIDLENRSLCRVGSLELGFTEEEEDIGISSARRIKMPDESELLKLGQRKIVYADVDANMHMNNTNYPDMLCGFIDEIEDYRIKEFEIDFVGEAPYLETLDVFAKELECECGREIYFKTLCGGANNVNAHFLLEKK